MNVLDSISLLALLLGFACPFLWLVKDEVTFRLLGAVVPFGWAGLNYAQGLLDSSLILFVIGLRALAGLYLMKRSMALKSVFAGLFLVFFTAMLFKGYEDAYSILPWFAACLTTVVQIFMSGVALRLTQSIGADGAWIVYDVVREAWGHLYEKCMGVLFNAYTVRKMLRDSAADAVDSEGGVPIRSSQVLEGSATLAK